MSGLLLLRGGEGLLAESQGGGLLGGVEGVSRRPPDACSTFFNFNKLLKNA